MISCQRDNGAGSRIGRPGILIAVLGLLAYAQTTGPVVVLIGAPGSGKTTQAEILRNELSMTMISAGDLIASHRSEFARFRHPDIQGVEPRLDPALNRLVEEALVSADRSRGVILDGYPASKDQGDYLAALREKLKLSKVVVIHLRVPDDVSRKRLRHQNRPELEQQIKDYHRELDFARDYFPEADIRDVDATRKPEAVAKDIRKILTQSPL